MADDITEFRVSSAKRDELIDITDKVQSAVSKSTVSDGVCHIYVPHTTAGVTINEGADPAVKRDILTQLDKLVPRTGHYAHMEGNADAHIKTSIVGSSETILVRDGRLLLGTWQSVYFCEFDGPRSRKVLVRVSQQ